MTFNPRYCYMALGLFVIEVCIAMFIDDRVIRPFVGDVLVVILIYCFIRTFWKIQTNLAIVSVFVFACAIETLQYFNVVDRLGLQTNTLLRIIIGTTADGKDILAYAVGAAIVLGWEHGPKKTAPHCETD